MRVLLIHAHPNPDSLSAALRDRALEGLRSGGHTVRTIALYPEIETEPAFEPCMSQ